MDTDWREVAQVIRDLLAKSGVDKSEIKAVGLGGKGVGVCFLDESMRPVRNAVLWNDARCTEMANEWIASGKMAEVFGQTGNWLMTGDVALVLNWMKENEPENLAKTKYFCLNTNWISYNLTGEFNANATDMFSQVDDTRQYSEKVMEIEGILDFKR